MLIAEFEEKELNEIIDRMITDYQDFLVRNIIKDVGNINVIFGIYGNSHVRYETYEQFNEKEIGEILKFMNLKDNIISKNSDKKILLDFLIDELLSKLNRLISSFTKKDLLTLLYQLSSYIAESHMRIIALMQKNINLNNLNNIDNIHEFILTRIASIISDYKQSYIVGILGMDKAIIQYLFSLAAFKDDYYNQPLSKNKFDIVILFKYAGLITYLIQIRNLLMGKFVKDNDLIIENFSIYLSDYIKDKISKRNINAYFEDLNKSYIHEDKKEILFLNFEKRFGFNPILIEKYILSNNKFIKDNNLSNCVSFEVLELSIINNCNCSKSEADSMINYLLFEAPINKKYFFNSVNDFPKRILSNSILKLEKFGVEMYMISYPLMMLNYELLRRWIFYDHIKELNGRNTKIINKINDKLSIKLKKFFEGHQIMFIENFNKYSIVQDGDLKIFILPRELDGAFVHKKVLYLIECKNIIQKFESKGFNKDIQKSREYIEIMIENKEEIQKRLEHFEILFNSEIQRIEMKLIFNNYNILMDSDFDTKGVEVYTLRGFIEWFKKSELNLE